MAEDTKEHAVRATEETLEANVELQEHLNKYILDLENEQEKLDQLIDNLSKVEAALPEERSEDEVIMETAPYGESFEFLRHTLTTKQMSSEASPFCQSVTQRQRYELLTTTRPFTREEQRLLHTSVIIENKRLHALRARARGEDPFAAVESLPDDFFDKDDPEISWTSVAQNVDFILVLVADDANQLLVLQMSSNPPRNAEQCRIMYVSNELPSINRSDWPPDELELLKTIVEAHNSSSAEPVEDVEENRDRLRVDWVEIARELGNNRTALQCLRKFVLESGSLHKKEPATKATRRRAAAPGTKTKARDGAAGNLWSDAEDKHLREGIQRHGVGNWPEVALHVNAAMSGSPGSVARTPNQCSFRYTKSVCPTIKKGKWSQAEDEALRKGVAAFGRTWTKVQEYVEGRTDAQCRERWSNMLDPSLKTGPWDEEEDRILLEAAGQKLPWSRVSALLPGRTDNRCAKRYQILIKQQKEGPGREGDPTPAIEQPQKRPKTHKRFEKGRSLGGENEAENTPVADANAPSSSNANVTPVLPGATAKPRQKQKQKPRPEANPPVGPEVSDSAKGKDRQEAKGDSYEPGPTENIVQENTPQTKKTRNSDKHVASEISAPEVHTIPPVRRSTRVANKR